MTIEAPDSSNFIVSCCNQGGGIYRLSDGRQLWEGDARGIDVRDDVPDRTPLVYVASKGRVRRLAAALHRGASDWALEEEAVSKRDGDWHGLKILRRGQIGVIDPVSDCMYVLDPETLDEVDVVNLTVPYQERWHCQRGRQHFNDLAIRAPGLPISYSSFANGISWIGSDGHGMIDLELVDAQPHSVTEDERGVLWWCESAKGAVVNSRDGRSDHTSRLVSTRALHSRRERVSRRPFGPPQTAGRYGRARVGFSHEHRA